ncbi:MAG: TonB-dependent receptor [Bacteroidota bacterium]
MKLQPVSIAILLISLLSQASVFGQNTSIKLVNSSNEPVPFANVALYKVDGGLLKGMVTDNNGVARFDLNQIVNYEVSFVGYQTLEGQINKGENLSLEMVEELDMLDAIVVTGQYGPQKADQSIYKIDVVDDKQLEQRGVNNLAEALSQQTFIRLSNDPATGTSIKLQGMGGENVKYLIDGVPIVGRVNGNIDLSQINMDNVDHIEIVQGPMSVVYGTSALAGVINIITKKNTARRNMLKANGYADNKTNYKFGFYGSAIRGKHSLNLSGNRNIFQGIDIDLRLEEGNTTGTNRYMEYKPKLVYNGNLDYSFTKNDRKISVKTDYMRSEVRNYSNANINTASAIDQNYITNRSTNSLTINDKIGENLSYNFIGAYTYFLRNSEYIYADLSELTYTIFDTRTTLFKNGMTRGNFTYTPKEINFNFQFGWDINYDRGTGDRVDNEKAKMGDFAAFASAQWAPLQGLSLQPGLRFIHNTSFQAPLIPSINLQWEIINNLNFRLSYAKGFRAPSLKELYLDFHDSNHNLTGNPDLKAETTDSYNSSFTYKIKWDKTLLKFEPSFYYNNGRDVITMIVTDDEANAATNTNLGGRKTLGANFNVTFVHFGGLNLSAGYSLTGESFADEEISATTGESIYNWRDQVNYSNYTFNAKYSYDPFKVVIMANYKLYGETPRLAFSDINPGELYYVNTESYNMLEVTISKQLLNDKLNLVLGGKNLFDIYTSRTVGYEDGYVGESPINYGRTYFVRANFKF